MTDRIATKIATPWLLGLCLLAPARVWSLIDRSLEAAARAESLGKLTEDSPLRSVALSHAAMLHAMRGAFHLAHEAGQQALETARALISRALAQGYVGYVCFEREQPGATIAAVEEPIVLLEGAGLRQVAAPFMAVLSEAHLSNGTIESARAWAARALAVSQEVGFAFGVGWAERALDRIELATGTREPASHHLNAALATLQALGAEFEIARTRLPLAELAHLSGDGEASGAHLIQAAAFFETAQASSYTARVAELATRIGVNLAAGGRA